MHICEDHPSYFKFAAKQFSVFMKKLQLLSFNCFINSRYYSPSLFASLQQEEKLYFSISF